MVIIVSVPATVYPIMWCDDVIVLIIFDYCVVTLFGLLFRSFNLDDFPTGVATTGGTDLMRQLEAMAL
jgi:hypothetical protein